ncbi:MAG: DUF6622 family protein [Alphaproteobacteria bacterium]
MVNAIQHTPLWVWALLAVLVWRGLSATRESTGPLWRYAIVPVAIGIWGLSGLVLRYPLSAGAIGVWLGGLALGGLLAWRAAQGVPVRADPARGTITVPGTWSVLVLILAIFAVKYWLAYRLARDPALAVEPSFYLADVGFSGLATGGLAGRVARYARAYRSASAVPAA